MTNIFVGNLNSSTTPETIRSLFEPLGTVRNFKLMTDPETGSSRGFAFVEMREVEAGPAISALDGKVVDGQTIAVREGRAKRRTRRTETAPRSTPSTASDPRAGLPPV